ncbi:MAG: hypothetical protein N2Z40_03030 [Caldimicrobium sp.]|nr:hypothetical protein [Caldimicrobium sp.]MCX7613181.1 hypothetical protein [Caldimicrobium sp.]MDW8182517.1 hypothetical protein [Caldimicrobium sp.]
MIYFIRARTHYNYAISLWKEISEGKRKPDPTLLEGIFHQALKALYAVTEVSPKDRPLTNEEILEKVLPTLSDEEKRTVLKVRSILYEKERFPTEILMEEMASFLEAVKRCLQPIL